MLCGVLPKQLKWALRVINLVKQLVDNVLVRDKIAALQKRGREGVVRCEGAGVVGLENQLVGHGEVEVKG